MKKTFLWLGAGLVCGVLTFVVSPAVHAQNASPPFTATAVEKTMNAAGKEIRSESLTFARRSDGTQVKIAYRTGPNGSTFAARSILDPHKLQRTVLDPLTESIVSYKLPPKAFEFRDSSCTGKAFSAKSQILGYEAVQAIKRSSYPDGTLASETWFSPALGCLPLRDSYSTSKDGVTTSTTAMTVLSVKQGEPDNSLFEIPLNYKERTPSEVLSEFHTRFPDRGLPAQETLDRLDQAYKAANAANEQR